MLELSFCSHRREFSILPAPPIFHVNREARIEACRYFRKIKVEEEFVWHPSESPQNWSSKYFFFRPSHEILFLKSFPRNHIYSSAYLSLSAITAVEHIAIITKGWSLMGAIDMMYHFVLITTRLKSITIIPRSCSKVPTHEELQGIFALPYMNYMLRFALQTCKDHRWQLWFQDKKRTGARFKVKQDPHMRKLQITCIERRGPCSV
ncbi:hypothetical protein EJ04DRAFT_141960 [Polyplosphaeria fusca]|uniref:Uncharacterized protein n=1 Tax=Polyplosphaeria fusca TaxID=682080 RepID=A0A9P4QZN3_9PLEO|nr:hypothetical protein EJ04DRAFT_141960 [Polyplosphaeria fusca]